MLNLTVVVKCLDVTSFAWIIHNKNNNGQNYS